MMIPNETYPRVDLEAQQSYLRNRPGGDVRALQLCFDHPRPPVPAFLFENASRELDLHLRQQIHSLCGRTNATLDVFLLAVFETLLFRYTHQEDFVFRSIASDSHELLDSRTPETITSPVAVYANLDGDSSFSSVLKRLIQNVREAPMRQDYPFEKIQCDRNIDQPDISRVMFIIAGIPTFISSEPIGEDHLMDGAEFINQCDLVFLLTPSAERLTITCQYDAELFEASTIERMLGHFLTLLEGIVRNPEQRISELPLLTEAEKHRLLIEWNATRKEHPKDHCVHQLFEAQVQKTPDAVAVVFEDQQLTYRDLNERANQLAHYLRKLGVGPEALAGVCVERSMEMVVGLLAILKAGGAYVPLDPSYPSDRLKFILSDSRVPVLLTQSNLEERSLSGKNDDGVVPRSPITRVCFDRDRSVIEQQSRENPATPVQPHDLAYVIYTSGSTGTPKGVAIEHRQTVAFLSWALSVFTQEELGGVLASTSFCFDLSIFEIFAPLSSGGTVIVVQNALALASLPEASTVTLLNTVPSAVNELLNLASIPPSVRVINLAGEPLRTELVRRIYESSPVSTVHDLYGPSECTTYSTWTVRAPDGPQTIGRPIANTQIYILDGSLNPVPIGVVGEIYIGGDGVARGYLNRPELTAERFIPDSFSSNPGARLYRTGDLARFLPDANIAFLGRTDHQVKIRGYRIELGEIEDLLARHPAIKDAVVLATDDHSADRRLVVYAVAHADTKVSAKDLRSFLHHKLPEHMVPSAFVFLDSLPLTPNGKLDRKALPEPDHSRPELESAFAAPRSSTEELIARIWAEVLKVERVGIQDNFFELGGHSLLATQVISRLRETFHLDLPLRSLFESPTVAGLSQHIERSSQDQRRLEIPPLYPMPRNGPASLSFAQERLWFLDQLEPGQSVYHMTSAFRLMGRLNTVALERSLEEIVRRHETLRTTFSTAEERPVQIITPLPSAGSKLFNLPISDLGHLGEEEQEAEALRRIDEEIHRPFNLTSDLMLRAGLFRLGAEEHILFLVMHHIACDGWSMGILYREIAVLYEAFSNQRPSPLPELPIQYADFSQWQRDWLQGEALQAQVDYWKRQLRDLSILELPTDRPRPAVQTYRGRRTTGYLAKGPTDALKALSQSEKASLFMTLLAAFQMLLYRHTGQADVVVGTPIAGRGRVEIEGLIGFFLNTLVLRTDVSGDGTFREVLSRVREVTLGAYAHQDVPFEKLIEELRPERDLSRTPLFQVFFNMVNVGEIPLELSGLQVQPLSTLSTESKFDLTLYVRERDGGLQFSLVYNTDLFNQDRMAEMLAQYERLLAQIAQNPEQAISSFSLVTAAAESLLPDPVEPLDASWVGSVHDRLSHHAARIPDHPAVADPCDTWTYRELNARSNQLAHCLMGSGVRRGEIVAIYGHRSASLVWAVFGILKAGAAFLILDPTYPTHRLVSYLRVAKPRSFVQLDASDMVSEELGEFIRRSIAHTVTLPRLSGLRSNDSMQCYSTEDPKIEVGPDEPAYISFTSGSTGEAKGVLGRHGSLSHFLPWQAATFRLSASERFGMLSGLAHDPLQRDMFTPLWLGATLCIPDPEIIGTSELAKWMNKEQVTFVHLTPALAELLAESADSDCRLPALRHVFFIGDKLTRRDVAGLRRLAPGVTCIAAYGSTETQRAVGFYLIPEGPEPPQSRDKEVYPLGRGLKDVQLLVLTGGQRLAGIGELGEIYVRSPHLALGYMDNELTRERFLPHSVTGIPGDRLYKTGDLGRYLPDGNVEFAGRADRQIKIRGFRVEPQEIERELSRHVSLQKSVVILREGLPGQGQLVAYLVSSVERPPTAGELQRFLKSRLPDYMIPAAFVYLDALPLTPNGKLDTQALPIPDLDQAHRERSFVAPDNELQRTIAEIWQDVLKIEKVGIHDKFFELGGHSLLGTQVISRVRNAFQVELPLRSLFETPTVAGLAEQVMRSKTLLEAAVNVLAEVETLSDEEARLFLAQENCKS